MLQTAQRVLEDLPIRNVVSWNVLIVGYAQQGQCHKALVCFEMMQREHIIPNEVTLLGILSACSHTGLLDEAQMLFSDMTGKYGIVPVIEHHTCMVFALGCAGHFEKAMFVIQMMQSFTCPAVWFALLASCQKWRNLELGKLAFGQVVQLEDNCAPAYVVMSNIFARAGLWKDAQNVESMRLKYAT
jgi:pentatricopeptide repeat protein